MKSVIWKDKNGFLRRSLIRDEDSESAAKYGIPAGPPDFEQLDWQAFARELNNALVENGLFTWDDVNGSPGSLRIAITLFKRRLIGLYREQPTLLDNEEL